MFKLPQTVISEKLTNPPIISRLATAEDISGTQSSKQELRTTGKFLIPNTGTYFDMDKLLRSSGKSSKNNELYDLQTVRTIAKALGISGPTSMKKAALIEAIQKKMGSLGEL